MKIFVGSLPFSVEAEDLRDSFEQYGEVSSANIIMDKMTGRSRGFGFVEMPDDEQAKKAMEALNGSDMSGRSIVVNEAQAKAEGKNFGPDKRKGGGYRGGGGFNKRW
jgi:RNA recognition motif-containing protein